MGHRWSIVGGGVMQDLQIPMRPIVVDVHMTTGAHINGSMFILESPHQTNDAHEVRHLLNDDRSFIPLAVTGKERRPFLLSKTHIVRVRLPLSEGDALDRISASGPSDVPTSSLLLVDGSVLEGTLTVVTPPSMSRLVDKLNSADLFLSVISTAAIDFVQRSHVVHVS